MCFSCSANRSVLIGRKIDHNLFHGFYPRMLARASTPRRWLNAYIETYLEQDVRELMEVRNRDNFLRFISPTE